MAEAQNQHSPWSVLALERRLEALCIPAMAVTGVAIILIQLAEKWVHDGPFPTDMKERFLKLYGWGSFGVLKFALLEMLCMLFTEFARRPRFMKRIGSQINAFIQSSTSMQRAKLHWSSPDSIRSLFYIQYFASILSFGFSAYYDTLSCYTQGLRFHVGNVAHNPCENIGIDKPELSVCKNARSRLFGVQMLSLAFAIVPAAIYGLNFAIIAYRIYISFVWMNRQLKIIREARARNPGIDAELEALEALDRLEAARSKRELDLEASLEAKAEAGFDEQRIGVWDKQPTAVTVKED